MQRYTLFKQTQSVYVPVYYLQVYYHFEEKVSLLNYYIFSELKTLMFTLNGSVHLEGNRTTQMQQCKQFRLFSLILSNRQITKEFLISSLSVIINGGMVHNNYDLLILFRYLYVPVLIVTYVVNTSPLIRLTSIHTCTFFFQKCSVWFLYIQVHVLDSNIVFFINLHTVNASSDTCYRCYCNID